jgi:flagellum-specific ATP synthase
MAASAAFPRLGALARRLATVSNGPLAAPAGTVQAVGANQVRVAGLSGKARLGDMIEIGGAEPVLCEAGRIESGHVQCQPFHRAGALRNGAAALLLGPLTVAPSLAWKGRIVDGFGAPLDGGGPVAPGDTALSPYRPAPDALSRASAGGFARTGVNAVDLFTPLCHGQRIGVFGAAGSGKSSLLGSLMLAPGFDSIVVGLIGERGREVRDFFEGHSSARRGDTIVVASTCDESAAARVLAANTAMLAAEYLRDRGENVLLVIDSVTRFAHAVRENSLASGDLPVVRGHTASLYGALSALMERAGPGPKGKGAVTAIFSVLVDGDDPNEPVSDAVRGILDGHVMLDRAIARSGRYPAINVLESISRLAGRAHSPEQAALVARARRLLALFEEVEEMRQLGGYTPGVDAASDQSRVVGPQICQLITQSGGLDGDPFQRLREIVGD